jgi:hypothetical protein
MMKRKHDPLDFLNFEHVMVVDIFYINEDGAENYVVETIPYGDLVVGREDLRPYRSVGDIGSWDTIEIVTGWNPVDIID